MSAQIKVATSPVEDLPRQIFPLRGRPLRVALVHDWLEVYAGAEKVLAQLLNIWPEADVLKALEILDRLGIAEQAPKRAEALAGAGLRSRPTNGPITTRVASNRMISMT